jgi:hypothetical protein
MLAASRRRRPMKTKEATPPPSSLTDTSSELYQVTVPQGLSAGDPMQVSTPAGLMQVVVPAGCVEGSIFEMLVPIQRESALPPIPEAPVMATPPDITKPSPGIPPRSGWTGSARSGSTGSEPPPIPQDILDSALDSASSAGMVNSPFQLGAVDTLDDADLLSPDLVNSLAKQKAQPKQALPSLEEYSRRGATPRSSSDDGSFVGKLKDLLESYLEESNPDSGLGDEVAPVKTFPASLEEITATQILKNNLKNLFEGNTVTAPLQPRDEGFKSKLPPITGGASELEEEYEPYEEYLFERIKSAAFFGTWSMIIVLATVEIMLKMSQSTPYFKWFPDFLKSFFGER